jgi:uncharacterized glyoxalase superfamily protein PhnB
MEVPQSYLAPALFYRDPKAAIRWLEQAFGLDLVMVILGADESLVHCKMGFAGSLVMIAAERPTTYRSPRSLDGQVTQLVHMQLVSNIDEHCARAREAGAAIQQEPETQPYGDRTYQALDLEGHVWTFAQPVEHFTQEQWDRSMGVTTRSRL